MRSHVKKATALLLAACMLLGLAACGKSNNGNKNDGSGDNANQLSGTVYVPEFIDLKLEAEYINSGCSDGQYIYLIAETAHKVLVDSEGNEIRPLNEGETDEEAVATLPEGTEGWVNYNYTSGLFKVSLDGQTVEKMDNFTASAIPEGMEGNVNITSLRPGADGTLWICEEMYTHSFDLPADFDPETDDQWNYYVDGGTSTIWRQIDSTGNELNRVETTGLTEKLGVDYINTPILDGQGNIYVNGDGFVAVLDKDMNQLFKLEGDNLWGTLVQLGDGSMGMLVYPEYVEGQDAKGPSVKVIDLAAKNWGEEYPVPSSVNNLYTGSEKYLFYYDLGDSLFGYNAKTKEGEKILSWISADINRDDLMFFTLLPDGRVAAMTRSWNSGEGPSYELVVLTETDASVLADKTVLTYATMYLSYDVREKVLDFNKNNTKYRIEIRDYSEFNTNDDFQAGLKKLNVEISAGQLPDMLDTNGINIRQYGAKGVLEDLWPFIDNDPDLGRDKLMVRPLEAASQDGKLYQLFSTFSIQSVVGATRAVGDRMSWTLADLQAALATMPEGCTIFGQGDTKENILSTVMSQNMDSFVDWTTGQCNFNSPEFIALLEFANSFPLEFDWEDFDWESQPSTETLLREGKQMLQRAYVYDLTEMQRWEAMFGGDFSYIGYPREDGGVGSTFSISGGIAMTTKCKDKDGAWSFMRQMILPAKEGERTFYYGDFPINKEAFDAKMAQDMEKNYVLDEKGEIMKDENGNPIEESKGSYWVEGQEPIEMYAADQADYDKFMALYNAVDSVYGYDEKIYNIVREEALAYFNGDKTVQDAAQLIQSRVNLYVNESK